MNAQDSLGSTALERIVLNDQSHVLEEEHSDMQAKVLLLLQHGASYHKAMNLVDKVSQELCHDYPSYIQKYQLLKEILAAHHTQNHQMDDKNQLFI